MIFRFLYIFVLFLFQSLFFGLFANIENKQTVEQKPFIVMINPAGHAKNVGRRLVESVERAVTFDFAKVLQKELQEKYSVRVILTRYPGEEIVDWEAASFANRLGVDFYLSLHIYREEVLKPKVFLYHLLYNPLVDKAPHAFDIYNFISVHTAHYKNIGITTNWGDSMADYLKSNQNKKNFDTFGLYGIPFKPLCGILAPAVAIEVGICKEDQWRSLVLPIVESFYFLEHNAYTGM